MRYAPDSSVHHSGIITPMTQSASVWVARFMGRRYIARQVGDRSLFRYFSFINVCVYVYSLLYYVLVSVSP